MIRNKERIDLNITPKKIAQNSRNSWRLSGRDVGAQGQLTQGANWCSPETKYKSSRIAFYITSIAFKLKKTWNQIAEAYRLEPRSSCVNGNCRKYFYIHERQTDHNIQDARKEKKRIPQLWQVSVPNFQQGLVVWENTYQQKWMISWANPMIQKKACWGRIDLNITIGPGHDWIYHMTMMKHRDQRKKERKLLWHVGVQIKLSIRHPRKKGRKNRGTLAGHGPSHLAFSFPKSWPTKQSAGGACVSKFLDPRVESTTPNHGFSLVHLCRSRIPSRRASICRFGENPKSLHQREVKFSKAVRGQRISKLCSRGTTVPSIVQYFM